MVITNPDRTLAVEKEWQYRSIFDAASDGIIVDDLETGLVVEANPMACSMHGYAREDFIGRHLTTYILPDNHHVFNEYIRAFQADGLFVAQVVHIRQDGTTFHASWRGSSFTYQGRPCLLGIVRDISKRVHSERLLHQRVETRNLEQSKLLEISHTLASTLEFHPGLILDQLHEIIAYSHGGLFALDDSTLVALAMRGTPQLEQASPVRIHLHGPETLAALFNGHHPIRIYRRVGRRPPGAIFTFASQ